MAISVLALPVLTVRSVLLVVGTIGVGPLGIGAAGVNSQVGDGQYWRYRCWRCRCLTARASSVMVGVGSPFYSSFTDGEAFQFHQTRAAWLVVQTWDKLLTDRQTDRPTKLYVKSLCLRKIIFLKKCPSLEQRYKREVTVFETQQNFVLAKGKFSANDRNMKVPEVDFDGWRKLQNCQLFSLAQTKEKKSRWRRR